MKGEEKMVCIRLRFWTNDLNVTAEKEPPRNKTKKVCWDSGMACMSGRNPKPFNCFEDIIPVIKEHFREQRILVVSNNRRPRVLSPKRKS